MTEIKHEAFYPYASEIDEVILPNSLKYLGTGAFIHCNVHKLIFEKNVNLTPIPYTVLSEIICADEVIFLGNPNDVLLYISCKCLYLPYNYDGNVELLKMNDLLEKIECSQKYLDKVLQYEWKGYEPIVESPLIKAVILKKKKGEALVYVNIAELLLKVY